MKIGNYIKLIFKKGTQFLPKLYKYNLGWGNICFIIHKADYNLVQAYLLQHSP